MQPLDPQHTALLARAASPASELSFDYAEAVAIAIQAVLASLFPDDSDQGYTVPEEFWQSPLGEMVYGAIAWLKKV